MEYKYNYYFFNWADTPYGDLKEDGFNSIGFRDFKNIDNVYINTVPFEHYSLIIRILFHIYEKLHLPVKFLYPFYLKNVFDNNDNLCLLFVRLPEVSYLQWLRKKYDKAKFVLFLRDLYDNKHPIIDYYKQYELIDLWISYDLGDAKKYGMIYHPEVESTIKISNLENIKKHDVFFAGKAKNRLGDILAIYDKLSNAGLDCFFYIVDANHTKEDERKGIIYTKRKMKYIDVLRYSIQSNCILEINQEGAVGNTCRYLEAVIYNKKLLTNNTSIKEDHFYNPRYISVWSSIDDINPDFVLDNISVDYHYKNEFSPLDLLDLLEKELPCI